MDKFLEEKSSTEILGVNNSEREVIRRGLHALHGYFVSRASNLPKCLVFPDDSSRPLFWAAESIIRFAYGGKMPPISFLKENWKIFGQQKYETWLEKKGRTDNLASSNMYFDIQKRARQRVATKRIKEITQVSQLGKDDTVLVIDDYARSWNDESRPATRDRIRQYFANEGITNVDYFTFMTNVIKTQDPSADYLAGSLDPDPEAKYGWWSEGFSWKKLGADTEAATLGVRKQHDRSLYTQRVMPNTSIELRNTMREIGQQVLEEIQKGGPKDLIYVKIYAWVFLSGLLDYQMRVPQNLTSRLWELFVHGSRSDSAGLRVQGASVTWR